MELYYEVHEGEGPFLLMVHGMLSSRAQWHANLPALSRVSRPVVVELFGHGRSPSPDDPASYHPDAYVAVFDRLREALGAKRWALCGQSFGAALTLRYALRFPERVVAQIFTNSTSAFADPEWAARVGPETASAADAIEREGCSALAKMPLHPRHAKRLPSYAYDALVREAERLNPQGVARTLRVTVPACSLYGKIGGNQVPTLLVCGTQERRFERFRRYAEREMPHLEVVALEAGHAVNIEAARGFEEAVAGFVERHAARSTATG